MTLAARLDEICTDLDLPLSRGKKKALCELLGLSSGRLSQIYSASLNGDHSIKLSEEALRRLVAKGYDPEWVQTGAGRKTLDKPFSGEDSSETKRKMTEQDLQSAARLRSIWDAKRKELNLTQEKAAAALGFSTQGAVSQFLNGRIALHTDAVLGFARLLKVPPSHIRPEMTSLADSLQSVLTDAPTEQLKVTEQVAAYKVGLTPERASLGSLDLDDVFSSLAGLGSLEQVPSSVFLPIVANTKTRLALELQAMGIEVTKRATRQPGTLPDNFTTPNTGEVDGFKWDDHGTDRMHVEPLLDEHKAQLRAINTAKETND